MHLLNCVLIKKREGVCKMKKILGFLMAVMVIVVAIVAIIVVLKISEGPTTKLTLTPIPITTETKVVEVKTEPQINRNGIPIEVLMAPEVQIKLRDEPGTTNAKRAAEIANGTVLQPGDIFSYNKIVGERTKERGFITGSLPMKDKNGDTIYVDSVGSGVCRLSVALATTVSRTGLKQIEKTPHEFVPYYFETNKDQRLVDATVYWGNGPEPLIDNKFQNNKNFDIKIKCDVSSESILHVSFWKLIYPNN